MNTEHGKAGNEDRESYALVGCGILQEEVRFLIEKNNWQIESYFLSSLLHVDFNKLESGLKALLKKHKNRKIIVFYGCCHPLIDKMLEPAKAVRTKGQNCIDILLGPELFQSHLTDGAFFLLEDWARQWEMLVKKGMGTNMEIVREMFRSDRKYFLALNTPCSPDFTREAEQCSRVMQVPLQWLNVSLDHLEDVLEQALRQAKEYDRAS